MTPSFFVEKNKNIRQTIDLHDQILGNKGRVLHDRKVSKKHSVL